MTFTSYRARRPPDGPVRPLRQSHSLLHAERGSVTAEFATVLPAVMVVLLSAISPDFQSGVASPVGAACLCVAALIDALAVFIIQKIVAGTVK